MMELNFKKLSVLLAIASLFAVAFVSCSKNDMSQEGGGGATEDPPIGRIYGDTTTVKPDSVVIN